MQGTTDFGIEEQDSDRQTAHDIAVGRTPFAKLACQRVRSAGRAALRECDGYNPKGFIAAAAATQLKPYRGWEAEVLLTRTDADLADLYTALEVFLAIHGPSLLDTEGNEY